MRSVLLGGLALSAVLATASQAQVPGTKIVRSVQIIRLIGTSPEPPPLRASAPPPTEASINEVRPPRDTFGGDAGFRVHDLSRRWVEFEMRNSFRSLQSRAESPIAEADPSVPVGTAQILPTTPPTPLPLFPPLAVPAWMEDGLTIPAAANNYAQCAASAYRPATFLSATAENRRFSLYALMSDIACQYGIPNGLFDALIIRESGYQPAAHSPKNAFGLTQLMPQTAVGLGVNRYDIVQNLRGGAKYLRQQLDRFGQVHLALAAYNAGPGRVRNGRMPRITETQAYVDNVLLNWRRLAGRGQAGPIERAAMPSLARSQSIFKRSVSVSTY